MPKLPLTQDIKKKFKIVEDLFNLAYQVKYFQLKKQHPDWEHDKLHFKTIELIERGCA